MAVAEALVVGSLAAGVTYILTRENRDESDGGYSLLEVFFFWPLILIGAVFRALGWLVRTVLGPAPQRERERNEP